jgi:hypothetical protein
MSPFPVVTALSMTPHDPSGRQQPGNGSNVKVALIPGIAVALEDGHAMSRFPGWSLGSQPDPAPVGARKVVSIPH